MEISAGVLTNIQWCDLNCGPPPDVKAHVMDNLGCICGLLVKVAMPFYLTFDVFNRFLRTATFFDVLINNSVLLNVEMRPVTNLFFVETWECFAQVVVSTFR